MKIGGGDLSARQQTIALVDSETGEFSGLAVPHRDGRGRETAVVSFGDACRVSKPKADAGRVW